MKHTTTPPPNIVVLILDAVRARNMSGYGYRRRTTPHLDRFAAHNLRFTRAFAPATWTVPTHASLLTGLYLSEHRIENVRGDRRLHPSIVTLPALLRQHGYRTAAFSQNELFGPEHGFTGFERFETTEQLLGASQGSRLTRYRRKLGGMRVTLDAVRAWLVESSGPALAVANVTNAHYPWAPPLDLLLRRLGRNAPLALKSRYNTMRPYWTNSGRERPTARDRRLWQAMYDAALAHVDREIGRFLARCAGLPAWRNTVCIITADHGELLGDYRDLAGHMLCLSDRLVHVPLIVRHPAEPARSVGHVVETLGLFSSVARWAGVDEADVPEAQRGRAAWQPALAGAPMSAFAFAEEDYTDSYDVPAGLRESNPALPTDAFPRRQEMVRSAEFKLIVNDDRPDTFYDLRRDPDELANRIDAAELSAEIARHRAALDAWRERRTVLAPTRVDHDATVDDAVAARLRALGYLP